MKYKFSLIVLFISMLSCTMPALQPISISEEMAHKTFIKPQKTQNAGIVRVDEGLRLRSLPDGNGGIELVIIPNGAVVVVMYCKDFDGTNWAYGFYVDEAGKRWNGWVASRYLKGGCDDGN